MEKDIKSQNAMIKYLKSLDDIQVPIDDDLESFEQLASLFDNKVFEYNKILQEVSGQKKIADQKINANRIEIEML